MTRNTITARHELIRALREAQGYHDLPPHIRDLFRMAADCLWDPHLEGWLAICNAAERFGTEQTWRRSGELIGAIDRLAEALMTQAQPEPTLDTAPPGAYR